MAGERPVFEPYRGPAQRGRLAGVRRKSARSAGYTAAWQRYSSWFKRLPECVWCSCGCGRVSEQVDHIVPADPDTDAWWSMENHQALARPCHSRKTLRFDGACGRTPDTSAEGKAELQRMLDAAKRRAAAIQARELIHPGGSDFLARVISRNEAAGTRETMLPQKFQTRIDD